jgi:tetratricopeptide (TPR) repeat protein/DNA-binding winged helix-turn-helix (wHTH) protein
MECKTLGESFMEFGDRRQKPKYQIDPVLRKGFRLNDIVVLPKEGSIICLGEHRHLPPKAMEIMLFFCQNRNRLISIQELMVFGWGDANAKRANLTHVISEIRQALDDHKECPEFIQTLSRKGYRLIAQVASLDEKVLYPTIWPLKSAPAATKGFSDNNHWHLSLALFKNSRLFSVSIAFVVSTWVLIQVFEVLFPIFNVPEWGLKLAILVLVISFPLALLYTWLKEIKFKKVLFAQKQRESKRKFFFKQLAVDFSFIGVMSVGVGFLAFYLIEAIESEKNALPEQTDEFVLSIPIQNDLVAVLPVQITGNANDSDYFKATFQGELIQALTTQQDFKLVSQRAVNDLGENTKLNDYARKLGARYLFDAKIITDSNNVNVSLSLTDTKNALQVWGNSFSGNLNELLIVQKEIYRQVFNLLALLAQQPPSDNYNIINTNDFHAYDSYIQGKNIITTATNEQQFHKAEKYFLESLESDPTFSLATAGLCQAYLGIYEQTSSLVSFQSAKDRCSSLLQLGQLKSDGYTALGDLQRIGGKYNKAINLYQQAIELSHNNLDAISGLAKSYRELGNYQKADSLYRKMIQIEPGFWRNYHELGDFYFHLGNYAAASEQYSRVTLMRPNNASILNSLGASYYMNFEVEKAAEAWSRSLDLLPSGETYSNLGTSLFFSRQFNKAVESYKNALELKPNDPVLWSNLADAQKFSQQKLESNQSYEKALALTNEHLQVNKNDTVLLSLRAKIYAELGACDSANNSMLEIIPEQFNDPYLYYDFSIAAQRCGRSSQSKGFITKAIELGYPIELLKLDAQFDSLMSDLTLVN